VSGLSLSIAIVTYNRSQVLCDTLEMVFALKGFDSDLVAVLVVDQTLDHPKIVKNRLESWHKTGQINWIRLDAPDLVGAMNIALLEAKSDLVLYLDDDIEPDEDLLINHIKAHQNKPDATAVIGQVLQPNQNPKELDYEPKHETLKAYMDFPFNSLQGRYIENAMAGNMSLKVYPACGSAF